MKINKNKTGKKMDNRSRESDFFKISKDMLLRALGKRLSLAASVTVEASIILPIFLFFFANLLAIFDIVKLQCDLEAALHQTGVEIMASTANVGEVLGDKSKTVSGGKAVGVIDAVAAGKKVKSYLGEDYLNHSPIRGGASGLKFTETALYSGGDIIDIVATYKVHPLFGIAGFTDFPVEGRFYGHAFTGYRITGNPDESEDEAEEIVYITEHGTVYHKSLECSHLKVSIKKVSKSEVGSKRNVDGAKYYACESCGQKSGKTVYITDYGNRYHSKANCSKLKRTIKTVRISEAFGRSACKECAG